MCALRSDIYATAQVESIKTSARRKRSECVCVCCNALGRVMVKGQKQKRQPESHTAGLSMLST